MAANVTPRVKVSTPALLVDVIVTALVSIASVMSLIASSLARMLPVAPVEAGARLFTASAISCFPSDDALVR